MKPKLLIIGHARHGKDTVAELLRDDYGFTFESSSDFVGKRALWPFWGQERYDTYEEMFADRVNHRELWSNLINAYNTPDGARTATEMLELCDMYVGMRDANEFAACEGKNLFDYVVWVDGSERKPPEDNPKMTMTPDMADYILPNNKGLEELSVEVHNFVRWLEEQKLRAKEESPLSVDLSEMPEGAIRLLDHGYFKLVKVYGEEDDIAHAARVSYGRGTQKRTDNAGLIRYLYMNAHTSPFEMCEIKVQMRLPIFVMRQWVRHRTANLNEYSGRYSIMPRLFHLPNENEIGAQKKEKGQGNDGYLLINEGVSVRNEMERVCNAAFDVYEDLCAIGVARETAREVLPLNTYTEVVWKIDLNNALKLLMLRDDPHAQYEIRVYAQELAKVVQEHFPNVYAAYERRKSMVNLTWDQLIALTSGYGREDLPKSERAQIDDIQRKLQQDITRLMHSMVQDGPVKVAP